MTPLEATLRRAIADADADGIRIALVGGLAVATQAEPRLTRDVDLAVAVSDDDHAERCVRYFRGLGWEVSMVLEHQPTGRLGTVRLLRQAGDELPTYLDLLFCSCGIEPEIVARAQRREVFPGLWLPVASIGDLLAMKTLASDARLRPQDHDDIRALLAEADAPALDQARDSLALITARGFHRGRDLAAVFAAFLVEGRAD